MSSQATPAKSFRMTLKGIDQAKIITLIFFKISVDNGYLFVFLLIKKMVFYSIESKLNFLNERLEKRVG
jgi:hypothetical protein